MKEQSELRKLHQAVLRRGANGKTIWQPRIECWYTDREYRKEPLPGRFEGASILELYNRLGVSKRLYEFNACVETEYDPSIRRSSRKMDDMTTEHILETPVGRVNTIFRRNSSNYGEMPLKWWVETEEDLKVFTYIEEHTFYRFNRQTFDRLEEEWGHLGLPATFLPRITVQRLFIDLCGVENTIFLLADCPDVVEEYFRVLNRSQLRLIDVMCETPFEWINYGDNIHSKVLSPRLFEKYVLPAYQERNQRMHEAGKFTYAHFDGDVYELLPYLQDCGLDGIEAVTPAPQGDVTLKQAKEAMGDLFLIDGVDAILFDEKYPLEQLKAQTEECLNLFEGQLVLGISDELASTGTLDRVLYVKELVENFNARH